MEMLVAIVVILVGCLIYVYYLKHHREKHSH